MVKSFRFLCLSSLIIVISSQPVQGKSAPLVPQSESVSLTETVVKVFVTANKMDYYRPWQSEGVRAGAGSGVIIKGNRILTNAHVVSDHTFIQVKKDADSKKYTAKVVAIGHDCDLALLEVNDPDFFEGVVPLEFGELPKQQDSVTVIGYPQGGGKISITEGVVSRIEVTPYAQSARHLLTVQIDAAINPGNSGGPVVQDGKLVGIAMQVFQTGQNIGYMIPIPVIDHFFKDLEDGNYEGFPLLGIDFSNTENAALREYYGITNEEGGVLVTQVLPFAPASGIVEEGDVVLEINGVPIGEDGTFPFRGDERLSLTHLITKEHIGVDITLKIMRERKIKDLKIYLDPFVMMVPHSKYYEKPPYFIFGGIAFTVLSTDLMHTWGRRWWEKASPDLTHYVIGTGRMNREKQKEIIVLLSVLPDDINIGYHGAGNDIVKKVNGEDVKSFKDFVLRVNEMKNNESYTIIETQDKQPIILNNSNIESINEEILKRNNIPYQSSGDVAQWITESH